jgi:hypothetical protein
MLMVDLRSTNARLTMRFIHATKNFWWRTGFGQETQLTIMKVL